MRSTLLLLLCLSMTFVNREAMSAGSSPYEGSIESGTHQNKSDFIVDSLKESLRKNNEDYSDLPHKTVPPSSVKQDLHDTDGTVNVTKDKKRINHNKSKKQRRSFRRRADPIASFFKVDDAIQREYEEKRGSYISEKSTELPVSDVSNDIKIFGENKTYPALTEQSASPVLRARDVVNDKNNKIINKKANIIDAANEMQKLKVQSDDKVKKIMSRVTGDATESDVSGTIANIDQRSPEISNKTQKIVKMKKMSQNNEKYKTVEKIAILKNILQNKGLVKQLFNDKREIARRASSSEEVIKDYPDDKFRQAFTNPVFNEVHRLPAEDQLDMAPAKGGTIHRMRLHGALCQRNVLLPEGPKYDSRGQPYMQAYERHNNRSFYMTRSPRLLLPRCCNCCRKSVLGCE